MRRELSKLCAGRAIALQLGLCLAFLLWPAVVRAQSIAFINPGKSDEIYWVTATQGMQAAARSLGMNFEVQYAQREPLKTLEIARELAARPAGKRPEYVVITDDYAVADQLLKIIEPAGDGKLHMLAIAGDRSTPSSINRNQGMRRAVAEAPMVVLDQEVYAAWNRELAAQHADSLYRRYPDVKLIWAGNDLMAFGAMTAWEKRGGKPGVDAWFSGINTSTEALEAIKSGRLTSLAGGHFITGAWALVMIYDYHHGRDFADEGLELRRPMFAEFSPQLADRYIERFGSGFDGVDFSRYSKVRNPKLKRYNFGFAQLLEPQS
jgi:ABC-type sugar transport system substrate-binding protein